MINDVGTWCSVGARFEIEPLEIQPCTWKTTVKNGIFAPKLRVNCVVGVVLVVAVDAVAANWFAFWLLMMAAAQKEKKRKYKIDGTHRAISFIGFYYKWPQWRLQIISILSPDSKRWRIMRGDASLVVGKLILICSSCLSLWVPSNDF